MFRQVMKNTAELTAKSIATTVIAYTFTETTKRAGTFFARRPGSPSSLLQKADELAISSATKKQA